MWIRRVESLGPEEVQGKQEVEVCARATGWQSWAAMFVQDADWQESEGLECLSGNKLADL